MSILFWLLPLFARGLIGGYFIANAYTGWVHRIHFLTKLNISPYQFYFLIGLQLISACMICSGFFLGLACFVLIPVNIVMTRLYHPYWKYHGEFMGLHRTCYYLRMILGSGALLLVLNPMFFNSILVFIRRNYLFE
jgi:uncharacterized membrane protein YphA (DoxX/SURF4 family)